MPTLRMRLALGSLFWWVNVISKLKEKERRRLMKIQLESIKTDTLQQTDVVAFFTAIIFNKHYAPLSVFHSFRASYVAAMNLKVRI